MSDISDEELDTAILAQYFFFHPKSARGNVREYERGGMRAAIEALQALGWRKVEKKKSKSNDLSLGEILYGWDSKPFPPTSKPEGKV